MACERWKKVEKAAGTKMSEKRVGALPLFFFFVWLANLVGFPIFPSKRKSTN